MKRKYFSRFEFFVAILVLKMQEMRENRYLLPGEKSTFFPRGKSRVLLFPERGTSEGNMKRGFYREEKSYF